MKWLRANWAPLTSFVVAYGTAALVTFALTWPLGQYCISWGFHTHRRIVLSHETVQIFYRFWVWIGLVGAAACLGTSHTPSRWARWPFHAACWIVTIGYLVVYMLLGSAEWP